MVPDQRRGIIQSRFFTGRFWSGWLSVSRRARRPPEFSSSPASRYGGRCTAWGRSCSTTEDQSLFILQTRTAVLAITALALAAAMAERRRAEAAIEEQRGGSSKRRIRRRITFLAMLSHELRTPFTPVPRGLGVAQNWSRRDTSEIQSGAGDDSTQHRIGKPAHRRLPRSHQESPRTNCNCSFESMDTHKRDLASGRNLRGGDRRQESPALSRPARRRITTSRPMRPSFSRSFGICSRTPSSYRRKWQDHHLDSRIQRPQSLTITVTDSGIGIEPEIMDRIFDRFEQGERSFQRRFGGLGLGLTISKSFVEAHGGTLVAESEGRGRGARFSFRIKTVPARARVGQLPTPSSKSSRSPFGFCSSTIIPTPALRWKDC